MSTNPNTRPQYLPLLFDIENRNRVATTTDARHLKMINRLMTRASWVLNTPAPIAVYRKTTIRLDPNRTILIQLQRLAFRAYVRQEKAYIDRLEREVLAVCAWPDLNIGHTLDCAEYCMFLSMVYSWFSNVWPVSTLITIRGTLLNKALTPILNAVYNRNPQSFWVIANNNWNIICNASFIVAAYILKPYFPDIANDVTTKAIASLEYSKTIFEEDGAFKEGFAYLQYFTPYYFYLQDFITQTGQTSPAILPLRGADKIAEFRAQAQTSDGSTFNFGDAGGGDANLYPGMFWFAAKYNLPSIQSFENARVDANSPDFASDMGAAIYYRPEFTTSAVHTSKYALYPSIDVGFAGSTMRVGFKGGKVETSHSDLDFGSFVLNSQDERFVKDLGQGNYNWASYFVSPGRWNYYIKNNFGHNGIVINEQLCDLKADCALSNVTENYARVDLLSTYPLLCKTIARTFNSRTRNTLIIQDAVDPKVELTYRTGWHTDASVFAQDANSVTLIINTKKVKITWGSPRVIFSMNTIVTPEGGSYKRLDFTVENVRTLLRVTYTITEV